MSRPRPRWCRGYPDGGPASAGRRRGGTRALRPPEDADAFAGAVRRVIGGLSEPGGLTGVLGPDPGMGEAPWLELDTPAVTNGWWATTGTLPAVSVFDARARPGLPCPVPIREAPTCTGSATSGRARSARASSARASSVRASTAGPARYGPVRSGQFARRPVRYGQYGTGQSGWPSSARGSPAVGATTAPRTPWWSTGRKAGGTAAGGSRSCSGGYSARGCCSWCWSSCCAPGWGWAAGTSSRAGTSGCPR